MRSSEFGGWEALLANPMVGRTISLLLRLGLFHVDARLGRSVPACVGTVIDAGVRVDPDLDIGIALGRGGFLRRRRFRWRRLRGRRRGRWRLLRSHCRGCEQREA